MIAFNLRPATESDLPALAEIYIDAVQTIGREAYSPRQVAAWQRWPNDEPESFRERILAGDCWLVEVNGIAAAFAAFTAPDHLDFLYTRGQFGPQGLAARLHHHLELRAKKRGATLLSTEASLLRRPTFEKFGYEVFALEEVERFKEMFPRFLMRKFLAVTAPKPCRADHRHSFAVAPKVRAEDEVTWIEADSKNPGWFKGSTRAGVEGFFPTAWFAVDRSTGQAIAQRDYDAAELTVEKGELLGTIEPESGWVRVKNTATQLGWVPAASIFAQP